MVEDNKNIKSCNKAKCQMNWLYIAIIVGGFIGLFAWINSHVSHSMHQKIDKIHGEIRALSRSIKERKNGKEKIREMEVLSSGAYDNKYGSGSKVTDSTKAVNNDAFKQVAISTNPSDRTIDTRASFAGGAIGANATADRSQNVETATSERAIGANATAPRSQTVEPIISAKTRNDDFSTRSTPMSAPVIQQQPIQQSIQQSMPQPIQQPTYPAKMLSTPINISTAAASAPTNMGQSSRYSVDEKFNPTRFKA